MLEIANWYPVPAQRFSVQDFLIDALLIEIHKIVAIRFAEKAIPK